MEKLPSLCLSIGIWRNLTGRKNFISSTISNLCIFGRSENQDCHPGLWLAETFLTFSSATAVRNLTELDRKQKINVLYKVCGFRTDWKTKMAAPVSDWLRHYLILSFETTEGNLTKLDRKQDLNVLYLKFNVFSGRSENPGLWLAETFSTTLKPLNGIWQNLKDSTSSTKFLFFGPFGKPRWLPWPLIFWDILASRDLCPGS